MWNLMNLPLAASILLMILLCSAVLWWRHIRIKLRLRSGRLQLRRPQTSHVIDGVPCDPIKPLGSKAAETLGVALEKQNGPSVMPTEARQTGGPDPFPGNSTRHEVPWSRHSGTDETYASASEVAPLEATMPEVGPSFGASDPFPRSRSRLPSGLPPTNPAALKSLSSAKETDVTGQGCGSSKRAKIILSEYMNDIMREDAKSSGTGQADDNAKANQEDVAIFI